MLNQLKAARDSAIEAVGLPVGGKQRYVSEKKAPVIAEARRGLIDLPVGTTVEIKSLAQAVMARSSAPIDVITTCNEAVQAQLTKGTAYSLPPERRFSYTWTVDPEDYSDKGNGTLNPTARLKKASDLAAKMPLSRANEIWNKLESQNGTAENPFREKDDFHVARFIAVAAAIRLGKMFSEEDMQERNIELIDWIEERIGKLFEKPEKDYILSRDEE